MRGHFMNELHLLVYLPAISKDFSLELTRELVYTSGKLGKVYAIPAGFRSQGAMNSRLIPRCNRVVYAEILHDWLIRCRIESTKIADYLFFEALRSCNIGWISAKVLYLTARFNSFLRLFWRRKHG